MSRARKLLEKEPLFYPVQFGDSPEDVRMEKVKAVVDNSKMRLAALMDTVSGGFKTLDMNKIKVGLKGISSLCNSVLGEINRIK